MCLNKRKEEKLNHYNTNSLVSCGYEKTLIIIYKVKDVQGGSRKTGLERDCTSGNRLYGSWKGKL